MIRAGLLTDDGRAERLHLRRRPQRERMGLPAYRPHVVADLAADPPAAERNDS